MDETTEPEPPRDTREYWDHRYGEGGERMWSGQPNGALVAGVEHLTPGTALDVGCGEGADAIWLAQQGWDVTAVDISEVAIARGRDAADAAGVAIDWRRVELPGDPLPEGPFDLVIAMYPAFRHTPGDETVRMVLDAVAPGGTLLVVHHSFEGDHGHHRPEGFDPEDYIRPDDVAGHLDDSWTVEVHEVRARVRPEGSPGPDVPDLVLRARRTS